MSNFQRKRSGRQILESKPVLALFAIIILIFAWSVLGLWNKMQDTAKNKKLVEDKITELQIQKQKLTADINSLNTDEGKEKIFRENYGLAKEGEDLIVVEEDKNAADASKSAESSIISFFKNLFK
jgi:cell division protein FtsB